MRFFLHFILLFFLVGIFSNNVAAEDHGVKEEGEKSQASGGTDDGIPTVKPSLAADFVEMMNVLREESPSVYERVNEMPREAALQKILTVLDTGVILEKKTEKKEPEKSESDRKEASEVFSCLRLTGKKIPYFRIDELSWEQAFQIVGEATEIKADNPEGMILDMRETANGDYYSAVYLADALAGMKSRIIVLMSSRTGGMPSLLPSVLKQRKVRMTILGMPSYTPIFPTHAVRISGNIWRFPMIADEFRDISPYPLLPDLQKTAMPRVDYLQLKSHPNELGLDPLLRLAADLLILNSAMKL